ncbi:MAG: helix-turn-helix domain-containing protein [Patescibacteria group bacterium]
MDHDGELVQQLRDSGLSDKSSKVYALLITEGGAYPSAIAERTHLNRSTVYKVLTELTIQGLVNEIERGKKLYYIVESPQKLVRLAKRKAETALDHSERAEHLLPELLTRFDAGGLRPRMRYFEGHDAVLSIYEDHIQKTKPYEMLAIANSGDVMSFLPEKFYARYRRVKANMHVTTRGILPANERSTDIALGLYGDVPMQYRPTVRYLSPEKFPLSGEIVVYRTDRVSIVELSHGHISGIIIEDAGFNTMMRSIFNLAWAGASEK